MSQAGRRLGTSIFKFTVLVGVIQGSCKVLGFVEKLVLGYFFGTQTAGYACYIVAFEVLLVTHEVLKGCLLYTSPSPRDATLSRMPSSA